MELNILLVILVILYFVDFKKYFVIYMAFAVWLSCFFSPKAGVFGSLSEVAVLFYLFKHKQICGNEVKVSNYPLLLCSVLLLLSYTCSNFFTGNLHYNAYIGKLILMLSNVYILWSIFEGNKQKYIRIFIRYSIIFAWIICIYGVFETITRTNPLVHLFEAANLYYEPFYITEIRFGLKRAQSVFMMHTTLACTCICIFGMLYCYYDEFLKKKSYLWLLLLLFFIAFTTGSRSGIIAMVLTLGIYFRSIGKKQLAGIVVATFVFVIFQSYFESILGSIQDTEQVGGSNTDMRTQQFLIAIDLFNNNPWFGNGLGATFSDAFYSKELLGAESLWIPCLIEQGVLGCIATGMFFIQCFVYCIRMKQKHLCFFVLAMVVMFSMTSVPQVNFTYIFIYLYVMANINKLTIKK